MSLYQDLSQFIWAMHKFANTQKNYVFFAILVLRTKTTFFAAKKQTRARRKNKGHFLPACLPPCCMLWLINPPLPTTPRPCREVVSQHCPLKQNHIKLHHHDHRHDHHHHHIWSSSPSPHLINQLWGRQHPPLSAIGQLAVRSSRFEETSSCPGIMSHCVSSINTHRVLKKSTWITWFERFNSTFSIDLQFLWLKRLDVAVVLPRCHLLHFYLVPALVDCSLVRS